ncbi:unnamed protein product [Taenia asiatica]|uniref:Fibronectin type-III domain-containing protein n=1 Tax=Taenia asiatica TaxID=60517 RepID=A0A0R3WHG0_TAEAS|nr:unnamed protein product [Taenia asiatica]
MPHLHALQPPFYELYVSWHNVTAKWGKPQLFQAFCTYLVDAFPLEKNAVRVMQTPSPKDETVKLRNLTPNAKYEIKLQSNCTNNEPFRTVLGVVETNPGESGIPADVQLTQIGPNMVNLTWTAASELQGKHPYYEWNC